MVFSTASFAQNGMPITVTPISCVAPGMNAKVVARTATPLKAARAYFTAFPQQAEYYVDMHLATDGSYWAVLPQVEPLTRSFSYRVVTTDPGGKQVSSPVMTATTAASCTAMLSTQEQQYANNLTLGKITDSQSSVPAGFTCRGIVSVITAAGQLKPNDECRRLLAAAGATGAGAPGSGVAGAGATGAGAGTFAGASAGTAAGAGAGAGAAAAAGGLSALAIGAIAAGAIVAGAVIVHNNNKNNNQPVSSARP